ncbi:hypothetical protein [Alkaliphilus transvaalensis]|nr:hypothetical protein [Alkaliphilus transvaalensis]
MLKKEIEIHNYFTVAKKPKWRSESVNKELQNEKHIKYLNETTNTVDI